MDPVTRIEHGRSAAKYSPCRRFINRNLLGTACIPPGTNDSRSAAPTTVDQQHQHIPSTCPQEGTSSDPNVHAIPQDLLITDQDLIMPFVASPPSPIPLSHPHSTTLFPFPPISSRPIPSSPMMFILTTPPTNPPQQPQPQAPQTTSPAGTRAPQTPDPARSLRGRSTPPAPRASRCSP